MRKIQGSGGKRVNRPKGEKTHDGRRRAPAGGTSQARPAEQKSKRVQGIGDRPPRGVRPLSHTGAKPDERREGASPNDYCWGRNSVISLLETDPARCLKVILSRTMQRGASERIINLCRTSNVPYSFLETRAMNGIIKGESHQGVIATVSPMRLLSLEEAVGSIPRSPARALVVLLDHIQDPHNLGAMIRSAEAAGAVLAAVPLRRASLPAGTVAKTSAGASVRLPIAAVGNVAYAVRRFQEAGLWAIGLDAGAAESIYEGSLPSRVLMVLGSEDRGLGRTTASACDELLRIPITGGTGSLNASAALAVGVFEWVRVNCGAKF